MRKKKNTYGTPTYSKKFSQDTKSLKCKNQHSILQKHNMRLEEFQKKHQAFQLLENKIQELEQEIKKMSEDKVSHFNNKTTNKSATNLNHQIYKRKSQLQELLKEKDSFSFTEESTYLLESSYIMQEYITLEEEESIILEINDLSPENSNKLNDINLKKNKLTDQYLTKFDPNYLNNLKYLSKEHLNCNNCNTKFTVESSYLVCPNCGLCKPTVEQANELSYKEMQDFDYRPQFTYDKMTHLEDWLRRFQAKENRSIPQEILDKVILEAKKERIQDLNILTEDKIKKYLKKLDLNDYYDNVIGIINRINGRPPFTLTPEIEEKIKKMFQQIQDPYEKYKPSGRKNFLSYSYTLHKFFQILNLHEFAKYFPLLKSTDKLRQQDDIFKKIVAHMSQTDKTTKWVFYPSI